MYKEYHVKYRFSSKFTDFREIKEKERKYICIHIIHYNIQITN